MTTPARHFKDTVYGQLARIGKAVSSPRRLELLDLLAQGPRTVEALAGLSGQSVANTSHHLKILRQAHLVESRKSGPYVTCRLAGDDVAAFWCALRDLGEARLAEVEIVTRQFLEDRGQLERVEVEVLVERVRGGAVTVLDVRPAAEYRAGHIPGALSVPLPDLERRIADLPRDREVVAYCRGPFCVLAVEAVRVLRARGFNALRLEEGVPEWRARGLPLVTTPTTEAP